MAENDTPVSKGPTWKQAVILVGAGIVLSASGCATAVVNFGGMGAAGPIGAIAFFAGVIVFIAGMYRAGKMVVRTDGPTWLQGLVPFGAGIVLLEGGWLASTAGKRAFGAHRDVLEFGGGVVCVAGALLILFGTVLLLTQFVRAMRNAP
jgi:hypothetical protein